MQLEYVGRSKPNRFSAQMHRHPEWELIYNITGTGTMSVDGRSCRFAPGTILLCPPGVYHNKQADEGFEDLYIRFTGFDRPRQVYLLKDAYDQRLLRLLQVLHCTWYEGGSRAVCGSLTDAILGLVRPMLSGMEQSEYVRMLCHIIADRFADPDFSIREAMSDIPINPDHLRRLFAAQMGHTPHSYLTQLRLEKAKGLLSGEYGSVAQVAYRCGFYDALYFSKVFRKATGIPPSRWR